MIIESMHAAYFKGFIDKTIDLKAGVNSVCGKNGTGKTTTGVMASYLFCGKDLELRDDPDIRNIDNPECDSRVDATCNFDGKKVILSRFQTDIRTKKQKEEGAPMRISNRYEINGVPKTQKDFYKALEAYGIDTERWLLLTNPAFLLMQKIADRRSIIFPLAGDVTDIDVANMIEECAELAKELGDNTLEEIVARCKAEIKRCTERQKAIPNEIAGMEKSKVEVDPDLQGRIDDLQAEIEADTKKRDEAKAKANTKAIDARIQELRNRKTELYNNANADRLDNMRKAHAAVDAADDAVSDAKRELTRIQSTGNSINVDFKTANGLLNQYKEELKKVKAQKFTGNTVCPTCGQKIPSEQLGAAKSKWEKQMLGRAADLEKNISAKKSDMDKYKAEGKELAEAKKAAEQALESAKQTLAEKQADLQQYTVPVDPNYSDIDAEISELEKEKGKCYEYTMLAYQVNDTIIKKQDLLQSYVRKQAAELNNQFIDDNIEEARESLKAYSQKKADAENLLYQVQLVSQKKNELLSDAVNSHFTRVKFRLFQTLKNGEIKDDCTPMVLCSDGEYRDMTYSANTAAVVMAKLDICAGLQKYYGQNLPIWLDGAECLDEANRQSLKMDNQLILLCVTEDEKLTVRG